MSGTQNIVKMSERQVTRCVGRPVEARTEALERIQAQQNGQGTRITHREDEVRRPLHSREEEDRRTQSRVEETRRSLHSALPSAASDLTVNAEVEERRRIEALRIMNDTERIFFLEKGMMAYDWFATHAMHERKAVMDRLIGSIVGEIEESMLPQVGRV